MKSRLRQLLCSSSCLAVRTIVLVLLLTTVAWATSTDPTLSGLDDQFIEATSGSGATATFNVTATSACLDATAGFQPATLTPQQHSTSTSASIAKTFQWGAVAAPDGDAVQYQVQVSKVLDFSVVSHSSPWLTDTEWTHTLPIGTWYWRVTARDSVHVGLQSTATGNSFTIVLDNGGSTTARLNIQHHTVTIWSGGAFPDPGNVIYAGPFDWWDADRSFLMFDTSFLGAAATVTSAKLYMDYITNDYLESDSRTNLFESTWEFPGDYNTYNNLGAKLASYPIPTSQPFGLVEFDVPAGYVKNTASTKFALAADDESDGNSDPGYSRAGSYLEITYSAPATATLPAPVLTPQPSSSTGEASQSRTFQWSAVASADNDPVQYLVEISSKPYFSNIAFSSPWQTETSWTQILPRGTWYWRVTSRDSVHPETHSAPAESSFKMEQLVFQAPPKVTCSATSGATFPIGITAVYCSATDSCSRSVTGSFNIVVRDTTPPALVVPPIANVEAASAAGARITYSATATDRVDPSPVMSCAPSSGSIFPLGTTMVTCSASDASGNSATGSLAVRVVDTTAPLLTLPPAQIVEATSTAGAPVHFTALATDQVDPSPTINCSMASGSIFPLGPTSVTCTVSDASGNSAIGSMTATVVDTTAPLLIVPADKTVEATGSLTMVDIGRASASDIFPVTISNDAPAAYPPGVTLVTWTARDSNNRSTSLVQRITVLYVSTPPVLAGIKNQILEATSASGAAATFDVTATSTCNSSVPAAFPAVTLTPQQHSTSTSAGTLKTFQWGAVAASDGDAVQYQVQVSKVLDFGVVSYSSPWMADTEWTQSLPIGTWYWRVTARDSVHPGLQSTVTGNSFTIVLDNGGSTTARLNVQHHTVSTWSGGVYPDAGNLIWAGPFDWWDADRSFLMFDTSYLGATATVTSAKLYLDYINADYLDSGSLTNVHESSWTFPGDYSTYSNVGAKLASYPIPTGHPFGMVQFEIPAGYVKETASTKFALAADDESDGNSDPGYSRATSYLEITYSAPAATLPAPVLTPQATAGASRTFQWSAVAAADNDPVQYLVEVSSNPYFSNIAFSSPWQTETTWSTPILPPGTWYWRVTGRDSVHPETHSAPAESSFSISTSQPTPISATCSATSGSIFPLGTTDVTCSATDSCNKSATGSFTIEVQDTTPPVLVVPPNRIAEATSAAGAAVTYSATATDRVDPLPVVHCLPASGSTFPLGATAVTCTASDASGNSTARSFQVTVVDSTGPVLPELPNLTVEATSTAGAPVHFTALATDNVDPSPAINCSKASGSIFPLGTTAVTCSARDASGNLSAGSFSVKVVDTTRPLLTVPGDRTVTATGPLTVVDIGEATAADIFPVTITNDAPAAYLPGVTKVIWTARDANGNSTQKEQQITVVDNMAPPVLSGITDQVLEATSVSGATAAFNVTATSTCSTATPAAFPAALLTPQPNSTGTGGSIEKTFQWSAVAAADGDPVQYQVQVSSVLDFGTVGYSSPWQTGTNWTQSLPSGTWYWRVSARDAQHPSLQSTATGNSFTILPDNGGSTTVRLGVQHHTVVIWSGGVFPDPGNVMYAGPFDWWDIDRSFLMFDTSSLGPAATVTSAKLYLDYVTSDYLETDSRTNVHQSTWEFPGNQSTFNNVGAVLASYPITTMQPFGLVEFPIPAGYVNKTASTKFALAADDESDGNSDPGYSRATSFLEVTYTTPAAATLPAPTLTPQPNSSASEASLSRTFQWGAVTAADSDPVQYLVEISSDPLFSVVLYSSQWQTGTTWTQSLPRGTWYWRVTGRDSLHPTTRSTPAASAFSITALSAEPVAIGVTCTKASGSTFPLGTTTVSCSATDSCGSGVTDSFSILVQDSTAPVLTVPGDKLEEAKGPRTAVPIGEASAYDIFPVTITNDAPRDGTYPIGVTVVTWTARDANGRESSGQQRITVTDSTAPAMEVPLNMVVEATSPEGAKVTFSLNVSDAADPMPVTGCLPASGSTFPLGTTTVTCSARDAGSNSTSGSFTIEVRDTTAPILKVPADITVLLNTQLGAPAVQAFLNGATATDLADPSVTITHTTPVLDSVGTKPVTFTATDDFGNSTTGVARIRVIYGCGESYLNNEETNYLTPVNQLKPFKIGSTIPVKLHLCDANGADVVTETARLFLQRVTNNEPDGDPIEVTSTNSDTGNYFRVVGTHLMFNLATRNLTTGTFELQAEPGDGTVRRIPLGLKP